MAPAVLYVCGAWDDTPYTVAIVGARAATSAGELRAYQLAAQLGLRGVPVVSGGAIGIDHAAHQGALHAGGSTCVVLGTGVDVIYPKRHKDLFTRVTERGCLLSMFPLGTPPKPWHFPARNRIIAALADVVVVVEAASSSGSRYTAQAAQELGRRVAAMPGSAGTDALIRAGVPSVDCAEEVLALRSAPPADALGPLFTWQPEGAAPIEDLPPEGEDRVAAAPLLRALDAIPRDLSELSVRAGLPAATCAALVVDLELRGLCTRLSGGRYVAIGHHS